MTSINERIAILRKSLGLTQEEFGNRIGVKKSAISKLENGTNNPTEGTIKLIVNTFPVNSTWLESGVGDMQVDELSDDKIDEILKNADPFVKTWMKALAKMPDEYWRIFKDQLDKIDAIKRGEAK